LDFDFQGIRSYCCFGYTRPDQPLPLLPDIDKKVLLAYGAMKEKSLYGRTFLGIERMTLVTDRAGIIRSIWHKVTVDGHAADVMEYVKQL